MKSGALFRTVAVGGFNRDDVINYVDNMSERAKHTEMKLQKQIEELTAERDELLAKSGDSSNANDARKIAELQSQLKAKQDALDAVAETKAKMDKNLEQAKIAVEKAAAQAKREIENSKKMDAKIKSLSSANERLTHDLESARKEAADFKSKYEQLKSQIDANATAAQQAKSVETKETTPATDANQAKLEEQINEYREKSRRYDEACIEIGKIKLDAHAEAESITNEAKTKAENVVNDALQKSKQQLLSAKEQSEKIINQAQQQAQSIVKQANETSEKTLFKARMQSEQTILKANEQSEQTINKANTAAETRIKEARELAEKTIFEANEKAEKIMKDANEFSEKSLSDVTAQVDNIINDAKSSLTNINTGFGSFKDDLDYFRYSVRETLAKLESNFTDIDKRIADTLNRIDKSDLEKFKVTKEKKNEAVKKSDAQNKQTNQNHQSSDNKKFFR